MGIRRQQLIYLYRGQKIKKAIFLIEGFSSEGPITITEKLLDTKDYIGGKVGYHEVTNMLYNYPSDYITFKTVTEFMQEVGHGSLPMDVDVFYYIQTFMHIADSSVYNLLTIHSNTREFLIKHQIPIIMDSTNDSNNTILLAMLMFKHSMFTFQDSKNFQDLLSLPIYIVGGEKNNLMDKNGLKFMPKNEFKFEEFNIKHPNINLNYAVFPSPFFFQVCPGMENYTIAKNNYENFKQQIKNIKVENFQYTWKAFAANSRLSRLLFVLYAQKHDLMNHGYVNRPGQGRHNFIKYYDRIKDRIPEFSDELINSLDRGYFSYKNNPMDDVDPLYHNYSKEKRWGFGTPYIKNSLIFLSLETNWIESSMFDDLLWQYQSSLTEKTSAAMLTGNPLMICGGFDSKYFFNEFKFKEYEFLELPDRHENYLDELEYTINKLKWLCTLDVNEKQKLWQHWSDTIIYNYEQFLSVDLKYHYLRAIREAAPVKIQSQL